ncbi:MAG: ArsC/Spx/MgsR family protein [Pseudomonadota bacterium]
MGTTLYGLKNCDTCRKAMKALPDAQLVDVRADGVPEAVLRRAFDAFGERLLNTRSTTWRGLDAAARAAPPIDLIKAHPALMKRPLIAVDNALFLSWNSEVEREVKAML